MAGGGAARGKGQGRVTWTHSNLTTQGYCLSEEESRELRFGLRFPTALCLALVVVGLALQSALMIALLVPIGAVAGWTPRHPFDVIWNSGLRHLAGAPKLPPNPTRRRHAFKLATVWLAGVAALFALGAATAALALGAVLVAVCGLVTVTSFCVPSTMLAWLDAHRSPGEGRLTTSWPGQIVEFASAAGRPAEERGGDEQVRGHAGDEQREPAAKQALRDPRHRGNPR